MVLPWLRVMQNAHARVTRVNIPAWPRLADAV
jgi:hypothetical protein